VAIEHLLRSSLRLAQLRQRAKVEDRFVLALKAQLRVPIGDIARASGRSFMDVCRIVKRQGVFESLAPLGTEQLRFLEKVALVTCARGHRTTNRALFIHALARLPRVLVR
jgi:hypothetical protein